MRRRCFISLWVLCVLFPSALSAAEFNAFYSELARAWHEGGDTFEWESTTPNNHSAKVDVFYRTFGDPSNPQLLLVHGFPNSSFDFYKLVPLLSDDYYIATLDFPGSGFSDKPLEGFSYMLTDNARLLDFFVREIVEFEDFALYTHDRGVSIGLSFLGDYLQSEPDYRINYHFLTNSGMYLPLANLVPFQLAMLDPARGPQIIAARKARPRVTKGDPEAVAYDDIFKFNDGDSALLHVGKYLLERAENETRWLENLLHSPVPVAYLWGLLDVVNPPRIAHHVWEHYLNDRDAESSFWILPTAAHYPQREKPEQVAKIVRLALEGKVPDRDSENAFMRDYAENRSAEDAIYIGRSEPRQMAFPFQELYTPDGYLQ